jgi:short-subunit dehydrogenase
MKTIAGKTVLLTGASRGIGLFIARALAKEQVTLVAVSRSRSALDKVCAEVDAIGCKAVGIPFDISKVEELPTLIEEIESLEGKVDILINNAGIEIYRAFQDYKFLDIQSVLSTNLVAAMELTRLLLPSMLNRSSGHIVNIASLAAKKGHPYDSIYSASKAGLLMWSDAVRQELRGTGVGMSVVSPGYVGEQGMLADTGIPAPILSGISTPTDVSRAVIRAIRQNKAEIIVNQNILTEGATKLFLTLCQFFPEFGDKINRNIGVIRLNQMRVKKQQIEHQANCVNLVKN